MIDAFANSPFSYTYNIGLDGSQSWTAQTVVVTLDYNPILLSVLNVSSNTYSNVNISAISSNVGQPNTNLPNPNNFTVTISATANQMANFMAGSLDPNERVLIVQTALFGNTGGDIQANNITLRVKNSLI